jgi:tRNA threonylcarbamoyladenosine biosynthesis protein TsaE
MKNKLIISIEEIDKVVDALYALMDKYKIFTFEGPLGAGKTTVIQELLKKCGIHQPITSPTFNYVNVYENQKGQLFYHFDLYRIQSIDDFVQAGFDEFLYLPDSWAFIEWPKVIMPLLRKQVCEVTINYARDNKRLVTFLLIDNA